MELEKAIALLKENTKEVSKTIRVKIQEAYGRVLAEDVVATHDQPPFSRSPLDGYAVRGADTSGATCDSPVVLRVIDEVDAGHVSGKTVAAGEAVRIMTGAPMPEGADSVIRQEDTDGGEDTVRVYSATEPFENYCKKGEDYCKGTVLLNAGTVLNAAETGVLASTGKTDVLVYSPLRALVISTGDELLTPGEELSRGKIYDSNMPMIDAALRSFGVNVTGTYMTGDDAAVCAERIKEAGADADLIVTSGGVSVGKKDILHEVVELLHAQKLFWQVDIKPGSPMLAALYQGKPLLCLSGNPYGAFVSLQLLVRSVVAYASRRNDLLMHVFEADVKGSFPKPSGLRRYVRAYYEDGRVRPTTGSNDNGVLSTLSGCNCLMEIPAGSDAIADGARCRVYLL